MDWDDGKNVSSIVRLVAYHELSILLLRLLPSWLRHDDARPARERESAAKVCDPTWVCYSYSQTVEKLGDDHVYPTVGLPVLLPRMLDE
jgi:hypothetical protein